MAYEALEDCADWLEKGSVRKAVRAAHDALHCSLVVLLHAKLGREHYPFVDRKGIKEHIQRHAAADGVVDFGEKSKKLLRVMATRAMAGEKSDGKSEATPGSKTARDLLPEAPDVGELIDIRHSIEHPRPGETAWERAKCVAAIRAGAEYASQALRLAECTYGAGLDAQLDRIRKLTTTNMSD